MRVKCLTQEKTSGLSGADDSLPELAARKPAVWSCRSQVFGSELQIVSRLLPESMLTIHIRISEQHYMTWKLEDQRQCNKTQTQKERK